MSDFIELITDSVSPMGRATHFALGVAFLILAVAALICGVLWRKE